VNTVPFTRELLTIDLDAEPCFQVMSVDATLGEIHRHMLDALVEFTLALHPDNYDRFFRDRPHSQPFLFTGTTAMIQWDGFGKDDDDDFNQWRLVWRDFVIGWYKHPKRCITANRYLSEEERTQFLAECKAEFARTKARD
jgi:hypothetical protein